MIQTLTATATVRLLLVDNRHGNPANKGLGTDVSSHTQRELLAKYQGRSLLEWAELGVTVFSGFQASRPAMNDGSGEECFFSLGSDTRNGTSRTWINTHNSMGVVRLRDKETGAAVQVEIGSRFDSGNKPYFLTYLLSKVFGGSIVDNVDVGSDSLWDMLLAFILRRRLIAASAVGLFRQYQTLHHNDARIRGRIDVNEHLRRNVPFRGSVAYSTHEISFDNPINHLIRHAYAKVKSKWPGCLANNQELAEIGHQLEQNTPTWQPSGALACIRHKDNRTPVRHPYFGSCYEPLRLTSLAILRDEGASLYQQNQEAEGVIFDGAWLWEEYLWTLLKPLGFEHPENRRQEGAWKPFSGVKLYPDFFHRNGRAILDAKYSGDVGVSSEHAKQVFAYMFLLDAAFGGLIKPHGNGNLSEPIRIKFEIDNKKADWNNLVLAPIPAEDVRKFVTGMNEREKQFKDVCKKRFQI